MPEEPQRPEEPEQRPGFLFYVVAAIFLAVVIWLVDYGLGRLFPSFH